MKILEREKSPLPKQNNTNRISGANKITSYIEKRLSIAWKLISLDRFSNSFRRLIIQHVENYDRKYWDEVRVISGVFFFLPLSTNELVCKFTKNRHFRKI